MQHRRWNVPTFGLLTLIMLVAALPSVPTRAQASRFDRAEAEQLRAYAADTWQSFALMTDAWGTGLPSDNVSADGVRSRYTSPTNIGTYLWSTLAARDLGIVKPREAVERIAQTLTTLERMERYTGAQERCRGQFYNWYDPANAQKLTVWPVDGNKVLPFLSSVDNGWLAAALIMVSNAVPSQRSRAAALVNAFDFGCYYDPQMGQIRGGYWPYETPANGWTPQVSGAPCDTRRPEDPAEGGFTCFHYGTHNTEPRIASYIGIAMGDIPPEHYFRTWRTFPSTCDWGWQEQKPIGTYRTYMGVQVFEGAYSYRGKRIVPTWGGSMFEALMVPLLVPEEQWGPKSWGINHPLYVEAQIEHGLDEAKYGYWGFSPSNNPAGGYREYGVDPIGMNPDGYASDQERTLVDYGFAADDANAPPCRPAQPQPTTYGEGVVTPHASFLALDFAPDAALANLAKLRANFDAYGTGGFYDAINVSTGQVSRYYLALDQGMIMASLANALRNDRLQTYFTQGAVEQKIKPLLGIEEFSAGRE